MTPELQFFQESPTSSHPLDPNGYGSDRNAASTPDDAPIMEDEESSVSYKTSLRVLIMLVLAWR